MITKINPLSWEELDSRPIPQWFIDSKFGIFIHWGLYSVPAYRPLQKGLFASYAEWYYAKVYANPENGGAEFHRKNYGENFEYRDFAPLFRAELWDPDFWAETFKNAGAKYVVLTSKHHDGFCLWNTKSPYKQNYNSVVVGPKRDILAELTTAVRNKGLKMGIYYSIIEWESCWTHRHPSGYFVPLELVEKYKIPENEYIDNHLIPQIIELVENYKPSLIFSDGGEWDFSEEYVRARNILTWLYKESPVRDEIVTNDRWFKGMPGNHGDYYSTEYRDVEILKEHPWEESRGIGESYGYNRAENLENYRTSTELIIELVDIVSRGGNLLLNVGPTADGRIPVIMQQRLKDIGDWLKVNGEAIYETRKNTPSFEIYNNNKIFYTRKNNVLYAIFTHWERVFHLKNIQQKGIKNISMMGTDAKITYHQKNDELIIETPYLTISELPCYHAWVFKIEYEDHSA